MLVFFMRLLDRYIFGEWLKIFGLSLGATLGVLMLVDANTSLHQLLNADASVGEMLWYYVALTPSLLPIVMPVSLLISVLFCMGQLHRNQEIIAMRAVGITLWRIAAPLFVAGGLLALVMLALNAWLVPISVEQSRHFKDNLEFAAQAREKGSSHRVGLVSQLGFDNRREGRLWMMNSFSQYAYRGFGVSVYQKDPQGREVSRTTADEAYYDDVDHHWVLLNGREMTFDPVSGEPVRAVTFKEKSHPDWKEGPDLMQTLIKRPKDLSFFEITSVLKAIPAKDNPRLLSYLVQYHGILSNPFVCLVVVGIAVPYAVAGVRTNPMVGVSKSAGLFLAFYILANICTMLGSNGLIAPFLAAWIPVVAMLGFSAWLFKKAV